MVEPAKRIFKSNFPHQIHSSSPVDAVSIIMQRVGFDSTHRIPCLAYNTRFLSDVHVSGPGIELTALEVSTPFDIGMYGAVITFDAKHCIQVTTL